MAEIWGAVAVAAGTVYAANRSGAAARAGQRGADAATAETARQYDQTRADFAPWRTTGAGAENALARLFGLPSTTSQEFQDSQDQLVGDTMLPAGTTTKDVGKGWYEVLYGGNRIGTLRPGGANGRFINDTGTDINALLRERHQQMPGGTSSPQAGPDMSGFFTSPDYQFRRNEGTRDIQGTFAARGGAQSGNALRALAEFNSNLASGEFGNYVNYLSNIAGLGQTATNQTAAYGANAAGQAGRNALLAGDARASGIENQANIIGQGLRQLGGFASYYGNRRPQSGSYGGTGAGGYPWDERNPWADRQWGYG